MIDNSEFIMSEARDSDIEQIWRVMEAALADDAVYSRVFPKVPAEVVHEWIMNTLSARWLLPDITVYIFTDVVSGRIAGWTALQFPWTIRPIMQEDKTKLMSRDLPSAPDGTTTPAYVTFMESLGITSKYGYDPETHYHRKGTMIHPDFQKKGLGTALTKHCNAISDQTAGRTFAANRPSSLKMFLDNGYVKIGEHDAELKRFGGGRAESITAVTVRDVPGK